eukprot:1739809-Prymnesium_polylepis.1
MEAHGYIELSWQMPRAAGYQTTMKLGSRRMEAHGYIDQSWQMPRAAGYQTAVLSAEYRKPM